MPFGEIRKVKDNLPENAEINEESKEDGEKNDFEKLEDFEQQVEKANNNMIDLISPYPDLVSHIAEGLRKNPSENQQFLELGYIVGETAKYLKKNDKSVYEDMGPTLNKYIHLVNEAKQDLVDIEFYNMFKGLAEKIKEKADRLPKKNSKRPWSNPFSSTGERTFYNQEG